MKISTISASTSLIMLLTGCTPKLMTYKKFSRIENLKLPRILLLESSTKQLLYVGSYHSNNNTDTIFRIIKEEFESFQPDFVFHEGGSNWPIYNDIDSTILVSGEPGFTIQLSKESDTRYASIEPPEMDEYKHLLSEYDLDKVVLMYLCRQIDQQKRFAEAYNTSDDDFTRNMNYFLETLSEKGFDLSKNQQDFNFWERKYREFLNQPLKWREFDPKIYYPNFYLTELNEINRASDYFRNKQMVKKIFDKLNEVDRVFVVLGGGHLIIQEKLIQHNFKNL